MLDYFCIHRWGWKRAFAEFPQVPPPAATAEGSRVTGRQGPEGGSRAAELSERTTEVLVWDRALYTPSGQ